MLETYTKEVNKADKILERYKKGMFSHIAGSGIEGTQTSGLRITRCELWIAILPENSGALGGTNRENRAGSDETKLAEHLGIEESILPLGFGKGTHLDQG